MFAPLNSYSGYIRYIASFIFRKLGQEISGTVPKKEICEQSLELPRKEESKISMNSQSQAFF